jgi:DNA polymerase-3 subunit epsilon
VKKYNKRVYKAIESFNGFGESVAIIGKGRKAREQSVVLVEQGKYLGFGFIDSEVSIGDIEEAKSFVRKGVETATVQNLINSYLQNPRGFEVVWL